MPTNSLLSTKMLASPLREYVIKRIKLPLQRAIENAATRLTAKFGFMEEAETTNPNTQCLKEHKARYLSYENNMCRRPLFSAVYDIAIAETSHDVFYDDRFGAEIEWIIKDILAGKWQERTNGQPAWNEPAPYGGKYSIVNKLSKHRKEILAIIGEANV